MKVCPVIYMKQLNFKNRCFPYLVMLKKIKKIWVFLGYLYEKHGVKTKFSCPGATQRCFFTVEMKLKSEMPDKLLEMKHEPTLCVQSRRGLQNSLNFWTKIRKLGDNSAAAVISTSREETKL